jgi:hypothetical protein
MQMRVKLLGFSCAVFGALCFAVAPASAQGRGHGNSGDHGNGGSHANGGNHGASAAHRNGGDNDRDGDRGDVENRRPDVPPGLAKKGGVPPGLAKKGGLPPGQAMHRYEPDEGVGTLRNVLAQHGYTVVRTRNDGTSRDVYYRYRNGALRRAVVSPGTNELGFSNVPSSVLRDLRSMLHY